MHRERMVERACEQAEYGGGEEDGEHRVVCPGRRVEAREVHLVEGAEQHPEQDGPEQMCLDVDCAGTFSGADHA